MWDICIKFILQIWREGITKETSLDGKKILRWILNNWSINIWIYLALDSFHWPVFVNTVMSFWVLYKAGNFLSRRQRKFHSTELILLLLSSSTSLKHWFMSKFSDIICLNDWINVWNCCRCTCNFVKSSLSVCFWREVTLFKIV